MSEFVITHPRTGFRFRLIGSHTSCAKVGAAPVPGDDCEGCGTKRRQAPA